MRENKVKRSKSEKNTRVCIGGASFNSFFDFAVSVFMDADEFI